MDANATLVEMWEDLLSNCAKQGDDEIVRIDLSKVDTQDSEVVDDLEVNAQSHILAIREACKNQFGINKFMFVNPPKSMVIKIPEAKRSLGKLVVVSGQIVSVDTITKKLKTATMVCPSCGRKTEFQVPEDEVYFNTKGRICDFCTKATGKPVELVFDESQSKYVDFRKLVIQVEPEEQEPGVEPETLSIWLLDHLVNIDAKIGDKVLIIGEVIFKHKRVKTLINSILPEPYIIARGYSVLTSDVFKNVKVSEEDAEKIHELAKSENTWAVLSSYISPDVYGLDDVKRAIVLQLIGSSIEPKRSMIHILLVGDPGTAKSTLLRAVKRLYPKSIYVSGKQASGRGLTAVAERDPDTGNFVIKAGALVLANEGIGLLDEIDKISPGEAGSLNEAMEHGTVSVSKGGRVIVLKSNTSLLAAANPKRGFFDPYQEIVDQIPIDKTVFSRFDLVFALRDIKDKEFIDGAMDRVLTSLSIKLEKDFFVKYLSVARKIKPKIPKETMDYMKEIGEQILGDERYKGATMRQFITLLRLAVAHARMKLREELTKEDVDEAKDLMLASLETISPSDSDFGALNVKESKSLRDLVGRIIEFARTRESFTREDLYNAFGNIEKTKLDEILDKLSYSNTIMTPRIGIYKFVR